MKYISLLLCILLCFGLVGCDKVTMGNGSNTDTSGETIDSDEGTDSITAPEDDGETEGKTPEQGILGEVRVIDSKTISYSVSLGVTPEGFVTNYRDLGTFNGMTPMKKEFEDYAKELENALKEQEIFEGTEPSVYEPSDTCIALQISDEQLRNTFSVFCDTSGSQYVTMMQQVYSIESGENEFDLIKASNQVLKNITGVVVEEDVLEKAIQDVKARASDGLSYTVSLNSEDGLLAMSVSVADYNTDMENWTLMAANTVYPGENFVVSAK